jgi:hypothetical protein
MISFPSEPQLVAALDRCDDLVRLCATGKLSFPEFCATYDNFYLSFPLDGHESDAAGLAVLAKYSKRIAPHEAVAETILSRVCADTDTRLDSYRAAGRIGSTEAVARLKIVAAGLTSGAA